MFGEEIEPTMQKQNPKNGWVLCNGTNLLTTSKTKRLNRLQKIQATNLGGLEGEKHKWFEEHNAQARDKQN